MKTVREHINIREGENDFSPSIILAGIAAVL